jgi:predicted AlkP superfamily phosphohydrolase/phosphomutase
MATGTLVSRPSQRADQVPPVMLIGISGATWSVIDSMLAEGELPNLGGLIRAGSSGVLESIKVTNDTHYRPQTAWPSVFSGQRPERHGITEYYHTSRELRSTCLWDCFAGQGLSAGLYSTPVMWPPPRINGFVIPLMYARDGRAWPEELSTVAGYFRRQQDSKLRPSMWAAAGRSARFLPMLFGHGRDWHTPVSLLLSAARLAIERDPETRSLILRHAKLDVSTAMFLALRRKYAPRLSIFVSFELDYISHRYWRYHEPEKFREREPAPRLRRAVKDAYAHIDRCVGALVKGLPDDRIVAVVSEHGMGAEVPSGEIGRWHYVIRAQEVKALAGVDTDVVAVPIARWAVFRRRDGGALDPSIHQALSSITVAETGVPLFRISQNGADEVVIKLDFSHEDYSATDDIGNLHVRVPRGGVVPIDRLLQRAGPTRSAMHRKEGVFVVEGSGIRSGHRIEGAFVTDVMPTLLRAAGLTPPPDLDGRPLDVFV